MKELLLVETSPRGEGSISRRLARRFLEHWQGTNPDGRVVYRDLVTTDLSFATSEWLEAYFTPPHLATVETKKVLELSETLVDELLSADEIAISTPVYNYNVPAKLKAWIDHIVRKGRTLGEDGTGLVQDKSATIILASGGVYTEDSPIYDRNIAEHYLRLILQVIGITDIAVIAGGGAKAVDLGSIAMDDFVDNLYPPLEQATG